MTIEDVWGIWRAFGTYSQKPEFMEGLFVEVSGMLFDILLLTIILPLLIWLYQLRGKQQALRIASFLSLQFIRSCVVLLLKAGGINSLREALDYEAKNRRLTEQFSHFVYGNTEDLLKLLRSRMRRTVHVLGHRSLENDAIQELRTEAQQLMKRCEQYTTLFASLSLHVHAEKYLTTGVLLLGLRDYLQNMKSLVGDTTAPTDDFRACSTSFGSVLDCWFTDERKRPDRVHKWRLRLSLCSLVGLVPYALLHRGVIGPVMTRLGLRYRAPFSLDIVRVLVEEAYKHVGRSAVFAALDLTGPQLRAVLKNASASAESIAALLRLRTVFDPDVWDGLLIQVITAELHRVKLNVLTGDSYIASAVFVYTKVAIKLNDSFLLRLMSWVRTYDGMFGPDHPTLESA